LCDATTQYRRRLLERLLTIRIVDYSNRGAGREIDPSNEIIEGANADLVVTAVKVDVFPMMPL